MASVCFEEWVLMWVIARPHEVLGEAPGAVGMVLMARIGARNSVA